MKVKFHKAVNNKDRKVIRSVIKYVNDCVEWPPVLKGVVDIWFSDLDETTYACVYTGKQKCHIGIKRHTWKKMNYDEKCFLIVHELAHIIAYRWFGFKIQAHGREWKQTMRHLGVLKPTAHILPHFDIKIGYGRRFGLEYTVSGL